ncbi:TonB-dependent receptor [Alteromonas sp. ASW11-19]|uniref:TonB-dependent receptor n=1 Tax=Alteromonas salexigens TaxID=2982530 RepID=A0ABT2VQH3_9ALTE|nr:TonB-dependent receptor [Alteromonas salexigens]MCU7555128.1 TonB-dependent receptor [Alteromonas salexigens]
MALILVFAERVEASDNTLTFDIAAQSADDALTEFARQANTTLLFPPELAEKITTNPLNGTYTVAEALAILLQGTELAMVVDEQGKVSVRSRATVETQLAEETDTHENDDEDYPLERIAVVGTRSSARSVVESPVPLDVIGHDSLSSQGSSDVLSMLSVLVPSLNVNDQPINDATSLVRPANLRGMASDHTLILLNGKRRHRSAVITFLGGGLSDGAQGPDVSVIPAYALQQVEVLRDGAAAQYGSDAIAGVINFALKNDAKGGSLAVKGGQYSQGDGEMVQVQGNVGLPLGDEGFINLTAEYRQQQATSRSVQRDDATTLIEAGNSFVADPAQIWGTLDVDRDIKFAANLGWPINSQTEGYAFGTAAYRDIAGGFYFRNPQGRVGVFLHPDRSSQRELLVADLDGVDVGVACPRVLINEGNLLDDPNYQQIAAPDTAVGQNCFAFNEWFPGGFTPSFGGTITDGSLFAGVRHDFNSGWSMDMSASLGYSDISYTLDGTVNPSMGPESPFSFSPGSVSQVERTLNIDLVKLIDTGLEEPASIASGAEWRRESYHQRAGDTASWQAGPYAFNPVTGIAQGFSIGSNGFPGYQPQSAGHWSRSNWALYSDLELYLQPEWQMGLAVRVERFSDFGSTFDGKLTSRYAINDLLALRGSVSTGFKAPTVGQSNVINVTTAYSANGLEDQATLPPTDLISVQLGATPLEPEESINLSLGIVAYWDESLYFTLDYFNIRLQDRISTTTAIPLTDEDKAILASQGRPDASKYNAAKYFTNDFDTQTQGIDMVLHYAFDIGSVAHTFIGAYNWTDTQVERVTLYPTRLESGETAMLPNLSAQRIRMLEDNLPAHRATLSLEQKWQSVALNWRINYYGKFYEDHLDASAGMDIEGRAVTTVDAEAAWQVTDKLTFSVGAQNLFNELPEENPHQGVVGALYPPTSPSGINGRFYYASAIWAW